MKTFEYPATILDWFDKRYPNGIEPFQMMTRLCEEAGELAKEVNHFEDSGTKRLKHGEPSKEAMAQEVNDVIRCALHIARYYHIEQELEDSIAKSLGKAEVGLKEVA